MQHIYCGKTALNYFTAHAKWKLTLDEACVPAFLSSAGTKSLKLKSKRKTRMTVFLTDQLFFLLLPKKISITAWGHRAAHTGHDGKEQPLKRAWVCLQELTWGVLFKTSVDFDCVNAFNSISHSQNSYLNKATKSLSICHLTVQPSLLAAAASIKAWTVL